jgi:hypothetical protein
MECRRFGAGVRFLDRKSVNDGEATDESYYRAARTKLEELGRT